MTPLMHAAYKGKLDMCRLLLRHGADVNCHQHEHGYTALMFAALSGVVLELILIYYYQLPMQNLYKYLGTFKLNVFYYSNFEVSSYRKCGSWVLKSCNV